MNLEQIRELCKRGKTGLIPKWKGYIKWNYALELIYFVNDGYILTELELKDKIGNRNDLYYII